MKQIKINNKCNQCGICVVKCPAYFSETDDGNIRVVSSSVAESDELNAAVNSCPVKAIELGAEVDLKQTIKKYVTELEKMLNGLTVTTKDIEFDETFSRRVNVPSAGASGYNYKSSSQAKSAGYDAFVSRSYSQVDRLILQRITDYRVTVIKPYYSTDQDSVYAKFNQKAVDILKAISAAIGAEKFPSDFCKVDIFPDTSDLVWKMLNKGEIIGDNFISFVKSEFSYKASDYKTSIDWDDMEDYRGKDKYCYRTSDATEELGNDLGNALRYAKSRIEDGALGYVNSLVIPYNNKIKACLEAKIQLVKKVLTSL